MGGETGRAMVVWRPGEVTVARQAANAGDQPSRAIVQLRPSPPRIKDRRHDRRLANGLGIGRVIDLKA